jgi:hypothetical protein
MAISHFELEVAVKKTVLLFNRLRSPQAVTKIVQVTPEIVVISFSGPFCYECGDVQKYIDDFAKDFKVFIDFVELAAGKAKETTPHSIEASYLVRTR